jgi:two-component SAPR family response regulator
MSGVELAEAVRGLRPGIKILFTSGFAENHRVGGGFRNTDVLLSKPYRRNELAGVLRRLLDRET